MTGLEVYRALERALLRLNPKMLGRGADVKHVPFQVGRKNVLFCARCALLAHLGTKERIPQSESVMLAKVGKGRVYLARKNAYGVGYDIMPTNDRFRGTPERRYDYVLAWARKRIEECAAARPTRGTTICLPEPPPQAHERRARLADGAR